MAQEITLELLREGDAHNLLLSPYTRYLAMCGDGAPSTVALDMEHKELLDHLARLRYRSANGTTIDRGTRTSEIQKLGRTVGRWLGQVGAFSSALKGAESAKTALVHLRLVLFGAELSLIPFELAILPRGFVGEELPLAFQPHVPITLTREVRRSRPLPVAWDREPRILFIAAAPSNMTVPDKAHAAALRKAIEPWVKWEDSAEERVEEHVKPLMSVITDASLEAVRKACSRNEFTHVHVLAHGVAFEEAGEMRYALALCADGDPSRLDHVSGRQLAIALQGRGAGPSVMTLMTCDSGNQASVLAPGGSIAHELHAFGVPWVIASQFPLTVPGSIRITESLYRPLLRGEDPRGVLRDIRQKLYSYSNNDHDWASLVGYAALPPDFEKEVARFRDRQLRRMLDVAFDEADKKSSGFDQLTVPLAELDEHVNNLPTGDDTDARAQRSEWLGMKAASEKRRAYVLFKGGQEDESHSALRTARRFYEEALRADLNNHWTAVQFLSLSLILDEPTDAFLWGLVRFKAKEQLDLASGPVERAWAHGTLAELELLSGARDRDSSEQDVIPLIEDHCKAIALLAGETSFPVFSTWRQFRRYTDWWQSEEWKAAAEAAVDTLTPASGVPEDWDTA